MTLKKPLIQMSDLALEQLWLIYTHDHTVTSKVFRIIIDSKGCAGFRYSAGFTTPHIDDMRYVFTHKQQNMAIAVDPFSAYYMQKIELDFIQDFENNQEGFIIKNSNENKHQGKFWTKDSSLIPKHLETGA